jgi:hypothetical protein
VRQTVGVERHFLDCKANSAADQAKTSAQLEIPMRRRHDANIHLDDFLAADALKLVVLQDLRKHHMNTTGAVEQRRG